MPPDDTRQGSLMVHRPRPHPFTDTTLPLLYRPNHCYNTPSICCLSCSPLPGSPRLPVPGAHVTPLEGGSPVGGHGDDFSGGSTWTVTGPLLDLPDLLGFLLFITCTSMLQIQNLLLKFLNLYHCLMQEKFFTIFEEGPK